MAGPEYQRSREHIRKMYRKYILAYNTQSLSLTILFRINHCPVRIVLNQRCFGGWLVTRLKVSLLPRILRRLLLTTNDKHLKEIASQLYLEYRVLTSIPIQLLTYCPESRDGFDQWKTQCSRADSSYASLKTVCSSPALTPQRPNLPFPKPPPSEIFHGLFEILDERYPTRYHSCTTHEFPPSGIRSLGRKSHESDVPDKNSASEFRLCH